MSIKLNAEELAAKRYNDEHEPDAVINVSPYQWVRLGYSCAIKEVAQPIADQRDELTAARAKDAELIQMLVDALDQLSPWKPETVRAMQDAKAAGFTPTEP